MNHVDRYTMSMYATRDKCCACFALSCVAVCSYTYTRCIFALPLGLGGSTLCAVLGARGRSILVRVELPPGSLVPRVRVEQERGHGRPGRS